MVISCRFSRLERVRTSFGSALGLSKTFICEYRSGSFLQTFTYQFDSLFPRHGCDVESQDCDTVQASGDFGFAVYARRVFVAQHPKSPDRLLAILDNRNSARKYDAPEISRELFRVDFIARHDAERGSAIASDALYFASATSAMKIDGVRAVVCETQGHAVWLAVDVGQGEHSVGRRRQNSPYFGVGKLLSAASHRSFHIRRVSDTRIASRRRRFSSCPGSM